MKQLFQKIKQFVIDTIRFFTYDIWRISSIDSSVKRVGLYNLLKSFILAIRNIRGAQLNIRAGALTYSTLLSIVPVLAVLFAIARGFGFQNIVQSELFRYFAGQEDLLRKAMGFIDQSIEYAKGGVFLGVGIVLLLYTVFSLLSKIESNFNDIWQIRRGRPYVRQFTDYLALVVITPVFLICNAGFSILLSTAAGQEHILGWAIAPIAKSIPYLITILLFVFLYMYVPNTKVRFGSALFAGLFTGIAFQIFQMLYIGGQIWISKYNAIYGSFAALPLLLLWLQLSWFICLFGAELAFAHQNVSKFDFEQETKNISRRYRDFTLLTVMYLIVKRFETGETPYTADAISERYRIPTQLTSDTLDTLLKIGLVAETPAEDDKVVPAYIPARDIGRLSVGDLFERVDTYGSEDFRIDIKNDFAQEWQTILNLRETAYNRKNTVLIKDL
ncbi:YihY/virulence factor BrkB family protein [Rikenella microfusus]|uniref:YihY/virulence factor BrkB family protein n=1 Tax=Rikenella microfusus TaxID=28139 RepID=UPI001D878872|nr:YihY/virulence factor BrkB family protein [Rikenella microfusus]HJE87469.1 YihY/virulence factor BrkB family protein [Rikenella microfusus]